MRGPEPALALPRPPGLPQASCSSSFCHLVLSPVVLPCPYPLGASLSSKNFPFPDPPGPFSDSGIFWKLEPWVGRVGLDIPTILTALPLCLRFFLRGQSARCAVECTHFLPPPPKKRTNSSMESSPHPSWPLHLPSCQMMARELPTHHPHRPLDQGLTIPCSGLLLSAPSCCPLWSQGPSARVALWRVGCLNPCLMPTSALSTDLMW